MLSTASGQRSRRRGAAATSPAAHDGHRERRPPSPRSTRRSAARPTVAWTSASTSTKAMTPPASSVRTDRPGEPGLDDLVGQPVERAGAGGRAARAAPAGTQQLHQTRNSPSPRSSPSSSPVMPTAWASSARQVVARPLEAVRVRREAVGAHAARRRGGRRGRRSRRRHPRPGPGPRRSRAPCGGRRARGRRARRGRSRPRPSARRTAPRRSRRRAAAACTSW